MGEIKTKNFFPLPPLPPVFLNSATRRPLFSSQQRDPTIPPKLRTGRAKMHLTMKRLTISTILLPSLSSPLAQMPSIVTVEHKVRVTSKVPSIAGQSVELYVRERFQESMPAVPPADRVVLFVHGAGTPAEVAFDVPHGDYSWMAYLARGGFVVYSMDTSGYGRSVRPAAMNDPCNLSPEQQKQFVPALIPAPCPRILSRPTDHDRVRLARHRCRRRLYPLAPQGRADQPRGVVAWRAARRRLRGAAS